MAGESASLCFSWNRPAGSDDHVAGWADTDAVKRIIQESIEVENPGLDGTIALDGTEYSPWMPKGNPTLFGVFDQHFRNLAALLSAKTQLKLVVDEKEAPFPPHSVKNVAIYCGWYSPGKYVPGCDFVKGAVGYHVASFEMVTLHGKNAPGWVPGLLNDGIDARPRPGCRAVSARLPLAG